MTKAQEDVMSMILVSLIIGLAFGIGWIITLKRLPRFVVRFFENHLFLTDVLLSWLTIMTMGTTVTGLLAAAWVSIIVDVYLHMSGEKNRQEEQEAQEQIQQTTRPSMKEQAVEGLAKVYVDIFG